MVDKNETKIEMLYLNFITNLITKPNNYEAQQKITKTTCSYRKVCQIRYTKSTRRKAQVKLKLTELSILKFGQFYETQ